MVKCEPMPSTPFAVSGEKCIHCAGDDALTHKTSEHDENFVNNLEPCDECGAESGKECHPSCRWAECPVCGKQQDDCNYGRNHP